MVLKKISDENKLSKITLITGGTKSGKSEFAEYLGKRCNNLTYVALSEDRPKDLNWQEKILIHRERRPKHWKLIETSDLISILQTELTPMLIDSIGGFIMENINLKDKEWTKRKDKLIKELKMRKSITLIVGEQVGLGLVSEYEIGNKYIERIEIQKKLVISRENWLTLNGRAIQLDEISFEILR